MNMDSIVGTVRECPKDVPALCIISERNSTTAILIETLTSKGIPVFATNEVQKAREYLHKGLCSGIVVSEALLDSDPQDFLQQTFEVNPHARAVISVREYSKPLAIEYIKLGAHDVIEEPLNSVILERVHKEMCSALLEQEEAEILDQQVLYQFNFHGIVGRSPEILAIVRLIRRISRHFDTALIEGPAGAGKSLAALAMHREGALSVDGFYSFACENSNRKQLSSFMETVLNEIEAIGSTRRESPFLRTLRPTILMRNIDRMPAEIHETVTRMIRDRVLQQGGTGREIPSIVRFVATTCKDLEPEVGRNRFPRDLLETLSPVRFRIPGLCERPEDIQMLAQFFLKRANRKSAQKMDCISVPALQKLEQYLWPGNLIEFQEVLSESRSEASGFLIDESDLPFRIRRPSQKQENRFSANQFQSLEDVKREHIHRVLDACKGNRVRAAALLGIGRTSLYRFLQRGHSKERVLNCSDVLAVGETV